MGCAYRYGALAHPHRLRPLSKNQANILLMQLGILPPPSPYIEYRVFTFNQEDEQQAPTHTHSYIHIASALVLLLIMLNAIAIAINTFCSPEIFSLVLHFWHVSLCLVCRHGRDYGDEPSKSATRTWTRTTTTTRLPTAVAVRAILPLSRQRSPRPVTSLRFDGLKQRATKHTGFETKKSVRAHS